MKKLLPVLLFGVALLVIAAQPPVLRQFGTTNTPTVLTNIIQSLAGSGGGSLWTNDGTFFHPITNTYPILINTGGGISAGTNVVPIWAPDNRDAFVSVRDVSAGEPTRQYFMVETTSDSSQTNYAMLNATINLDNGTAFNVIYKASETSQSSVNLSANNAGPSMDMLATNGVQLFKVDKAGTVTAKGFVGPMGYTNIVGGLTANITVVTNGANTATLHFTNGILMEYTAP